jgi:hypothetical protein
MMDGGTESEFWKLLREHRVDIYFAGEVHANTATKDPASNLLQVVSRGNWFDNFTTVDVSDSRVELAVFHQMGDKPSDGNYKQAGRLIVDKSGSETVFHDQGELALLDTNGRHFHFTFESDLSLEENPIVALWEEPPCRKINGTECTRVFPNSGTFGTHYSALKANVEMVDGIHGKAGRFTGDSVMAVYAMGPHYKDRAISYALWLKTRSVDNQLLINPSSRCFILSLNDGLPQITTSKGGKLCGNCQQLNDGQWHHIATTMPADGCLLSAVQIYVDGVPVNTHLVGKDFRLYLGRAGKLGFGGFGYGSQDVTTAQFEPFIGELDDISIWTRPLSRREISMLAK